MVYKRSGRPSLYFEGKTRHGWRQVCTYTHDKKLAQRIEHMWAELASRHRAWDLLEPVLADGTTIGALYDQWTETKHDVEAMRRMAKDVDVEPFVEEWAEVFKTQTGADWAAHALTHTRFFFPAGEPRMVSAVTDEWLTAKLAEYPGERNTRRKVHSSLTSFFDFPKVKKLFPVNPMSLVDRPALQSTPPALYDAASVIKIINWQDTPERRAFFALVYGTGADVSPALLVDRADVNPATHEVRIMGTKTAYRDRIVRVSDSAWPTFWKHAKTVLTGRVFPESWNRWTVSDWHRQTIGAGTKAAKKHDVPERAGLNLPRKFPLRCARHFFAVRLLQAGASIRVVSEQLGSDERTVLKHYGPWVTSAEDRARAEKMATQHETKRRQAK